MDKTYKPNDIESKIYKNWESKNYFTPSGKGEAFSLMIPPPNVTGSLHMGHGFGSTIMDIITRYHRMSGFNTLWQPGTDHAGIATQMVVERQLMLQGKSRHDLGRDKFIEKVWDWKQTSGDRISNQYRRLGISADWQREKFTMDDSLSAAVKETFIKLHDEGLIYRGTRLVNWDPKLLTAISDLEVINEEEQGSMWHIKYPLEDGTSHIVVATTRPETMLGDTAVAVHPEDDRYKKLIGKNIKLPLTERLIPIIADDYVEQDFGTGCVKITPAHDFNDYEMGKRHNLTPINILTPDAHLNENTPPNYQGLERFAARKQIVKDLEVLGLLEKIDKHTLKVPRGDRSGVVIEPYLTPQWYMKMEPLAKPAIEAVKNGDVKFVPENWNKTYYGWLNNIEDWCISRQLWWGHRIPAWHDQNGNIYVGQNEKDVREKNNISSDVKLEQDTDVLDTWFSSALWPFSTLGWPEDTTDLKTFYPTNVLVTGFDIIFFWVARMIMMGLKFTGKVPFKEVLITGLIRDTEGQKMSKSKGNIIDPLDLIDGIDLEKLIEKRTFGLMQPQMAAKIEKQTKKQFPDGIAAYGTDAVRFTFCALASHGREIRFDMSRLEGYRNFCNKIWNAARYVEMSIGDSELTTPDEKDFSLSDKWIMSRLQKTIAESHKAIKEYRFDILAQKLYEFTWNEFCDWYLELSKPTLTAEDSTKAQLNATKVTLITVLKNILLLLHPIMPYITEEIWQRFKSGDDNESIMLHKFPEYDAKLADDNIETKLETIKNIVTAIRTLKSELNVAPKKMVNLFLQKGTKLDKELFTNEFNLIKALAKIENVTWVETGETTEEAATAIAGELEILIPLKGLIDKNEESQRLNKEIAKLEKDVAKFSAKLQNPKFIDKAPDDVVAKERLKLGETEAVLDKLKSQLEKIGAL